MSSFQIYIIKLDSNSPRDIKELSEWVSNQIESTPVECPLPDYLPSIHISPTTIAVITFM